MRARRGEGQDARAGRALGPLGGAVAALLAAGCSSHPAPAPAESLSNGAAPLELAICAGGTADAGAPDAGAGSCPSLCPGLQPQGAWNAADAGTGAVAAVVELADEQVIFSGAGALVFAGGAQASADPSVTLWRGGAALPAPGGGTWAVGIGTDGVLRRVDPKGALEAVSDRFGLASGDKVVAAVSPGGQVSAFALESGLAVSDGAVLRRYDAQPSSLAGGGGKIAWIESGGAVRRFDPASGALEQWSLGGAAKVALGASGRLVVATGHELWGELPAKELLQLYRTPAALRALAASGDRFWFTQGRELGTYDGVDLAHTAQGLLGDDAALAPAVGGGVWTVSGGEARRWSAGGELAAWQQQVLPIFVRVCSSCHEPGGISGVPLSSLQAWQSERAKIQDKALSGHSSDPMPPAGSPQPTAAELAQLRCWVDAAP